MHTIFDLSGLARLNTLAARQRDYAIELTKAGFKVLPLPPGLKGPPLMKAWQIAPRKSAEQVSDFWTDPDTGESTDHNIAVQTGLGFIVLDFDFRHGGESSLARLDHLLPETFRVATPNGVHVYLLHPEPMRNGTKVFDRYGMPGVDLRAQHGYVVAPGSVVRDLQYTLH